MGTQTVSKNRRSKAAKSALAVTLALLLALGGTFAWTVAQTASGEKAEEASNPGGRMHDDFTWTSATSHNKDVYAENFGKKDLLVRVQLKEYLEMGAGAGPDSTVSGLTKYPNDSAVQGNNANWGVRGYTGAEPADPVASPAQISDYVRLVYGGAANSKYYMPTFNKDNTSVKADVNGSYRDDSGVINYSNYHAYAKDEVREATEYLNGGATREATHTAKLALGSKVITMDEWTNPAGEYKGKPGPYWVYDNDGDNGGWFYWAQAVKPGDATGLLLDDVSLRTEIDKDWYYAIDAIGEFVTAEEPTAAGDGSAYYLNDGDGEDAQKPISKNAYDLMKRAAEVSVIQDAPTAMENAGACEVTLDGVSYYKLARKDENKNEVMLLSKGAVAEKRFDNDSPIWSIPATEGDPGTPADDSELKTWLNQDTGDGYIATLPEFTKSMLVDHTYKTKRAFDTTISADDPNTYYETTSKVFLLSRADAFGGDSEFCTYKSQLIPLADSNNSISILKNVSGAVSWWWLRTPYPDSKCLAGIYNGGGGDYNVCDKNSTCYVRPAFWINLGSSNL